MKWKDKKDIIVTIECRDSKADESSRVRPSPGEFCRSNTPQPSKQARTIYINRPTLSHLPHSLLPFPFLSCHAFLCSPPYCTTVLKLLLKKEEGILSGYFSITGSVLVKSIRHPLILGVRQSSWKRPSETLCSFQLRVFQTSPNWKRNETKRFNLLYYLYYYTTSTPHTTLPL